LKETKLFIVSFLSLETLEFFCLSLSLSLSLSHSSYCYYIYTAAAYIREQRDWLCVRERAGETYIFFSGERVKGTSKTKRATEVHGDERDDKAGGRIKLLTWVLPSLISPFVTLYIKILLLFTTCCACSFLLSCLYIYIYIYILLSYFHFLTMGWFTCLKVETMAIASLWRVVWPLLLPYTIS
jgi:hypothetical protein